MPPPTRHRAPTPRSRRRRSRQAYLPVAAGQVALEIGAAPGGAALALARRGLTVWAVDPGALAPAALAQPEAPRGQEGRRAALGGAAAARRLAAPRREPRAAGRAARDQRADAAASCRRSAGAVLTLKLNDLAFVDELLALAARIHAMGLARRAAPPPAVEPRERPARSRPLGRHRQPPPAAAAATRPQPQPQPRLWLHARRAASRAGSRLHARRDPLREWRSRRSRAASCEGERARRCSRGRGRGALAGLPEPRSGRGRPRRSLLRSILLGRGRGGRRVHARPV